MKKLFHILCFLCTAAALSTAAFADAALPPPGYQIREAMETPIVPIILAVIIIAIVVLVKVIRARKRK